MNSASQNFPHHLSVLRERMVHPTAFESAVYYFLEEFAGDPNFVRSSDPVKMPHLVEILSKVVSGSLGKQVKLEEALVSDLREHKVIHGNGKADGRIVLFFYFREIDAGLVMIIPGIRGDGDIARFRTGGLADPQQN